MIEDGNPRVLEYNCRLGDPEAQAVLPLLDGDLAAALMSAVGGTLDPGTIRVAPGSAACVVVAAPGYPDRPVTGAPIAGVDGIDDEDPVAVFHAGTARDAEGRLVTAGGRVLGVTAWAETLQDALERTYARAASILFPGAQVRRDIGRRALCRETSEVEQV
jgi:phosphoribosylamine--glycine ligase